MNVVFAGEPPVIISPSIILAGRTPRSAKVRSWRPEALDILRQLGFRGTVAVPERRSSTTRARWEYAMLDACSVLAFWVPRDLRTLPGFTTNVEFGRDVGSGRPESAPPHPLSRLAG